MAYTTAENAAKWFLARNRADYKMGYTDEFISNFKLQKLLYYAQGCTLAITDKPLFDDEIVAWTYCPVIESVYRFYKYYGSNYIISEEFNVKLIPNEVLDILEGVYLNFGQYSDWKLRDMTRNETPWQNTLENSVIGIDEIKKYFKNHYIEDE